MKKFIFISLIFISFFVSCSIYELRSEQLNLLFESKPTVTPQEHPIVVLVSPELTQQIVSNSFPIILVVQETNFIKEIILSTPNQNFITNIVSTNISNIVLQQQLFPTNKDSYNTSHGNFNIQVSVKNIHDNVFKTNITLSVKILSSHVNITMPNTLPTTGGTLDDRIHKITFDIKNTGALVDQIHITGSFGERYYRDLALESGIHEIKISELPNINPIPSGIRVLSATVISENGGRSSISKNY